MFLNEKLKSKIIAFMISLVLISSILLQLDSIKVSLPFYTTTPFVLIACIYILLSFFLTKWTKLTNLSLYFVLSFLALGFATLLSTLLVGLNGDLINYDSAIRYSWQRIVYGSILFLFLIQHLKKYVNNEWYLHIWLSLTKIVIIIAVFQVLAVQDVTPFNEWFMWENIRGTGTRIASTFRWQGHFVMFLGLSLPLLASLAIIASERKKSILYLIYFSIGIGVLFFSGSRTMLGMLPLSFFPFILSVQKRFLRVSLISFSMVILTNFLIPWGGRQVDRVLNFATDPLHEGTVVGSARSNIISWGVQLWSESPFTGIGPNQLSYNIGHSAHNSYFEILIETGIIGAIPFCLFLLCTIWLIINLIINKLDFSLWLFNVALAMGLINFLIYNISASAINYNFVVLYYALCLSKYEDIKSSEIEKLREY